MPLDGLDRLDGLLQDGRGRSTKQRPELIGGLAEHSVLPAKLGELITYLAENLELHVKTLDLADENSGRLGTGNCRWAGMIRRPWARRRSIGSQKCRRRWKQSPLRC